MKRLALYLIVATAFAQSAGAKEIICSWQNAAGRERHFACHTVAERGVPNGGMPNPGMRAEDPTPPPEILQLVARTVRGNDIDPVLVLAVIGAESAFDRRAVSPKKAMGLMQLMPETVARFGVRNPFDGEENVRAGTAYLQLLLRKYGDLALALAAYNAGEGPVLAYGAVPPYEETTEYVARVQRLYERYKRIPFDRREPVKVAAATTSPVVTAGARMKKIGSCGLTCRGNSLAARLDDIARRMPVPPIHSDASWFGSEAIANARFN